MQISYNWLQQYLPQPISLDKLCDILTNIGLEVEGTEVIEAIKGGLNGVVVGEVLTCVPHPNADKLKVTTVQISDDTILDIVCGAPNVAAGQKILVATVGTTLYDKDGNSFVIKAAKIRGEASHGMICAEDELGLGSSHDGILVLPAETAIGTPAAAYFQLPAPETVIHIGLTPNRSDAMSHIGVARDVVTYLNHHEGADLQVQMPSSTVENFGTTLPMDIDILRPDLCPRFAGISIDKVTIAPSPQWLQTHLSTIGVKPINNIVDITNFVLHEYGQPLHAYDYHTIQSHQLQVGCLPADTLYTALDGKERKLRAEDLMILNGDTPLGMAGVMGGLGSSVQDSTIAIFLEAAYFDPKTIRRTSLHHQLRTDAATHFEKTANVDMVLPALERAVALILDIAGGQVASPMYDVYPTPLTKAQVTFRYDYISLLCGKTYEPQAIDNILLSMGFEILNQDATSCTVSVPFSKSDIHQAADIAEEILRIDGLNNVPIPAAISFSLGTQTVDPKRVLKEKMCQWLSDQGFNEILTNSIINAADYEEPQVVKMLNSLTTELNAMRPAMMQSGLEVLAYNINRGNKNLMMYEWGNIYAQSAIGAYSQEERLGIWTTGLRALQQWQGASVSHDVYFLKGIIEALAQICGISTLKYQVKDDTISYISGKQTIATITILSKDKLKKNGLKQVVNYAEIHIQSWMQAIKSKIQYKEVNKYPQVDRDLSIVVQKDVSYAQIEQIIKSKNFNTLTSYRLFDIFESEQIGQNHRAWALNFTFQDENKTLTDQEIDAMMETLMKDFEAKLNATIRK